jgi:hypothetical protein
MQLASHPLPLLLSVDADPDQLFPQSLTRKKSFHFSRRPIVHPPLPHCLTLTSSSSRHWPLICRVFQSKHFICTYYTVRMGKHSLNSTLAVIGIQNGPRGAAPANSSMHHSTTTNMIGSKIHTWDLEERSISLFCCQRRFRSLA